MQRLGVEPHYLHRWFRAGLMDCHKSQHDSVRDMFARKVAALLKPNALPEFTILMERKILPWLRKQEGFLDLITLAVPNSGEVATISFWDHEANADTYNTCGYPEVVEILEKLLDSAPYVKTFEVVSSTLQQGVPVPRSRTDHRPETGPTELRCRPTQTIV